jgi:diacylglycerol kinase (ATP)
VNRKLLFIINPKAGKKLGPSLLPRINARLKEKIAYEIAIWKNIEDFIEIRKKLLEEDFTDAIAVGGDGTVNMVAKTVRDTNLCLGILPAGSGNGLARSLGYPMNTEGALDIILKGVTKKVDSGEINGNPFFCTSGVGFDAHIGHLFASSKKRGLKSYIQIIRKEFLSYKPQKYKLHINGQILERNAFLITVGNASQYGNDFYIVPGALMNDGLFHVSVLKPFRFYNLPFLLFKILKRKADTSRFIETFSCTELVIEREKSDVIHFDGEPKMSSERVSFLCKPLSLLAIIGPQFKG